MASSNDISWVVDTGASFHAISHRDFFTTYESGDFGLVKMGNSGVSKMVGKGDVCIVTNVGHSLVLKDVRHIPDLRLNLISAGKLDDEGYESLFGRGVWKLTKGSLVVARGTLFCTLYKTEAKF